MAVLKKLVSGLVCAAVTAVSLFTSAASAASEKEASLHFTEGYYLEDGTFNVCYTILTKDELETGRNMLRNGEISEIVCYMMLLDDTKSESYGFRTTLKQNSDTKFEAVSMPASSLTSFTQDTKFTVYDNVIKDKEQWLVGKQIQALSCTIDETTEGGREFMKGFHTVGSAYFSVCAVRGGRRVDLSTGDAPVFTGCECDMDFYMSNTINNIALLDIAPIADAVYKGEPCEPKVTIKNGTNKLKQDTDYTLSYENNNSVGTGLVIITGIGDYKGEVAVYFNIVPKKTKLSVKVENNRYVLSWKAVDGVDRYQVWYSTDNGKTFTKAGNVQGTKTGCKLKLDNLKSYQFRIRSYNKIGKIYYYSGWSKVATA